MSVNAVMTVSIAPDSISERSSSMVSAGRDLMGLCSQPLRNVPGPDRLVPPGQAPGPEVQAARGRVDRADLPHGQRDTQDEDADQRPADRDRDRTPGAHGDAVAGDTAGQNGDDREGDGKVGEPAHPAVQLLLIAEFRPVWRRPGRQLGPAAERSSIAIGPPELMAMP